MIISGMVLLLGIIPIGDTDNLFAKKYSATQANSCRNSEISKGDSLMPAKL